MKRTHAHGRRVSRITVLETVKCTETEQHEHGVAEHTRTSMFHFAVMAFLQIVDQDERESSFLA